MATKATVLKERFLRLKDTAPARVDVQLGTKKERFSICPRGLPLPQGLGFAYEVPLTGDRDRIMRISYDKKVEIVKKLAQERGLDLEFATPYIRGNMSALPDADRIKIRDIYYEASKQMWVPMLLDSDQGKQFLTEHFLEIITRELTEEEMNSGLFQVATKATKEDKPSQENTLKVEIEPHAEAEEPKKEEEQVA